MAKITLEGLAHYYGADIPSPEGYALKPLSLVWRDGGAYALLGPSGCGKTTLLNIISGLLEPREGSVLFDGANMNMVPTQARNIAQVFQFPVIYDTMTIGENLTFPLRNQGMNRTDAEARAKDVAAMLGLTDQLTMRAADLSADIKQIVSLGRGLVRQDVNAILFDEPLTVIDPAQKWQLRSKLKELHREFGYTMLYVTHDQTEALTFADKVVVMKDGEVLQVDTPERLYAHPAHTFVGYFIGSPGMNVLPATATAGEISVGGQTVTNLPKTIKEEVGKPVHVGVRPEGISLSQTKGIPAKITSLKDLGRHKLVSLEYDGGTAVARLDEGTDIPDGQIHMEIKAGSALVYQDHKLVEATP